MGLGCASMVDPRSGASISAIGQFLSRMATALFLAADGHLVLIDIIVGSYDALPPGNAFPSWDAIGGLIRFGSLMFAAGLTIAMPVGFVRSEEHTSELQSLMRISYAVFCLKKKITTNIITQNTTEPNN